MTPIDQARDTTLESQRRVDNLPSRAAELFRAWLALAGTGSTLFAAGEGDAVVVIYNRALAESKELAFYYAQRRQVPTNQVIGFDLPTTETMTRAEFHEQLEKPLLKALERQKLLALRTEIIRATRDKTGDSFQRIAEASIR